MWVWILLLDCFPLSKMILWGYGCHAIFLWKKKNTEKYHTSHWDQPVQWEVLVFHSCTDSRSCQLHDILLSVSPLVFAHTNTERKLKNSDWGLWNGRKTLLLYARPDTAWQGAYFGFYHNMNKQTRNLNRGSRNAHKFFTGVWLFKMGENPETYQYWEMLSFLFLKKERWNNTMPAVAYGKQHAHRIEIRKITFVFIRGTLPQNYKLVVFLRFMK